MRSSSRSPWIVPSSPQRPCRAITATSICAATRRVQISADTSIPIAWYPPSCRALSMALPVFKETSCSRERPPISTPIRLLRHCLLTDDQHLQLKSDPFLLLDPLADQFYQGQDIPRLGSPHIDDEVRVQGGDHRVSPEHPL